MNRKNGQGTHSGKIGADKVAENIPNAQNIFGPICLPKPKKLGFSEKKLSLGVRTPWSYPNFLNKSHKKKRFGSSHYKSAMNALLCTTEHTRLLS